MAFIMFLALDSAALIGVGWRGGVSSLTFPEVTGTFVIFPSGDFRRCSYFVDLLRYLHTLGHLTCFFVGITFKVPYLYI